MATNSPADQTPEIETLREVYAAINRNDISGALKLFHPEAARIEPPGFPAAGTYRGHEALRGHFAKGRATWAEGACEPEGIKAFGDRFVVVVHVRVRLKDRADWIDARIADGFMLRNGKVMEMRSFADSGAALQWAETTSDE